MANTIRRLSYISEAITQAIKEEGLQVPSGTRRPSLQEIEDSALLFLERRKSNDSGIGNIQPDLYRKRGSIVNVKSSTKEDSSVAKIQLNLDYDFQKCDFIVSLIEATININLEECELWLTLLGDSTQRYQSSKILNQKFINKEVFKFSTTFEELLSKQLFIELISYENAGSTIVKHGKCCVDLSVLSPSVDLVIWINLEPIHEVENRGGEINLCLQYLQSAQRLSVSIHQANGLLLPNTVSSILVKASLNFDGKSLKKKKTSAKKSTPCPVWNEVLTFEIDPRIISKCEIEILIQDVTTGKNISKVTLGENSKYGSKIWKEALKGQSNKPKSLPLISLPLSR